MTPAPKPFHPNAPDAAGIITWVHIGDLHMTNAGEQNHLDLIAIVEEINRAFASSLAFVYIPGDVADQGSAAQYTVVRSALDALTVPWCSIVGDHDVHERAYDNYLHFMAHELHYAFTVGSTRFLALNAFDRPAPDSFCLQLPQLDWLESELKAAADASQQAILLLHCYPTDLKQGGERLRQLIEGPTVRLIDMGHTHYNELANDGRTLYTATRSTGQIEEGPVGFSVTNLDGAVLSWKFLELNQLPAVMITSPADERFITDATLDAHIVQGNLRIRAKTFSEAPIVKATAHLDNQTIGLTQIPNTRVWQGEIQPGNIPDGIYPLTVRVEDTNGNHAEDTIRLVLGEHAWQAPQRAARDQDNTIEAWPERGLLGTQLGPNRNGKKW